MVIDARRACWGFALATMLVIGPGRVVASPTPVQKCAASKLKATAKAVQSVAKCDAEGPGDGTCAAKAYIKAALAFGKADAKGGCPTPGDLPVAQAVMDRCRDAFTWNV